MGRDFTPDYLVWNVPTTVLSYSIVEFKDVCIVDYDPLGINKQATSLYMHG